MSIEDEDDRREYYRIDDRIALQFPPLSGAEALAGAQLQDSSPLYNLLSELHLADFGSRHLLRPGGTRDRQVAVRHRQRVRGFDQRLAPVTGPAYPAAPGP